MIKSFFQLFKSQGGLRLINDYVHSGVLLYVICQVLLTGFSKKSLEIVRLGVQLKIRNKLRKRFLGVLQQFDLNYSKHNFVSEHSNKVWVCWMQGIENAPALVQRCYKSLQANLPDREIILITSKNIDEYAEFPDYILDKYHKGLITHTHFSDLLRVELLCRHGGTWIDATVLCTGGYMPKYMLDSELFLFQKLKPGSDGAILNVSSWFITSYTNNKILLVTRDMLWEYWKKNDRLVDYFLLHHFISIISEVYADDWNKMIQFPNSFPHVLLLMLFEPFNQEKWDAVTSSCPFHKLAYKRSAEDMAKKGTYYEYIMNTMNI